MYTNIHRFISISTHHLNGSGQPTVSRGDGPILPSIPEDSLSEVPSIFHQTGLCEQCAASSVSRAYSLPSFKISVAIPIEQCIVGYRSVGSRNPIYCICSVTKLKKSTYHLHFAHWMTTSPSNPYSLLSN